MKKIMLPVLITLVLLVIVGCDNEKATDNKKNSNVDSSISYESNTTTSLSSTTESSSTIEKDTVLEEGEPTFETLTTEDLNLLDKSSGGSYSWRKRDSEIPENEVTYEKYEIIAEDKSYKNLYHLGQPHEFFWFLNTYLKPNNFNLLSMTFASDKEHNDTVVVLLAKPNPTPYSEVESNVHDFFSSEDFVEYFKAYYKNEIPSTIRGVSFHFTWVKDYYEPISISE